MLDKENFQATINGILGNDADYNEKAHRLKTLLAEKFQSGEVEIGADFDGTIIDEKPLRDITRKAIGGIILNISRDIFYFSLKIQPFFRKIIALIAGLITYFFHGNPRIFFALLKNRRQEEIDDYIKFVSQRTKVERQVLKQLSGKKVIIISRNGLSLIESIINKQEKIFVDHGVKIVGVIANELIFEKDKDNEIHCQGFRHPLITTSFKSLILPKELPYIVKGKENVILNKQV